MAQENDVVIIYFEEEPLLFARIEAISPDVRPEWFQVKLLLLQLPLQVVTWILRPAYIAGEPFTMDGKRLRLEKVVCPEETPAAADPQPSAGSAASGGGEEAEPNVISFPDLKKK
jgi:hypothetical protein